MEHWTQLITLDDNSTYEFVVKNGTNGANGDQYTIGTDGYWYKNGEKTNYKAIGEDGNDADVWTIGVDGYWYKNNVKTDKKAVGKDGNGIKSIAPSTNPSKTNETQTTYIITFDDNSSYEFVVKNGTDGTSYYVHIKYADERPTSNSISLKNYASDWMGIYTGTSKTAPTSYSYYTWYCIKGEDAEIPDVEVTFEYTLPEALTSRGVELHDISNITSYYNGKNGLKYGTATTKSSTWLGVGKMPNIYNMYIPSSWFKGWFIKGTEKQIDAYTCIGSDITVEMRWDENQIIADLLNSELYTYKIGYYSTGTVASITGYTGQSTELELPAYCITTLGNGDTVPLPVISWSSLPSNITGIKISKNIKEIGTINSTNLTTITVDNENAVYDSRYNCNAIIETATNKLVFGCSTIELPYDVVEIGNNAFKNSVNDLYISKNCLYFTIGSGNNINNLYLPKTLEYFDNKSQIENIYYSGTIEDWCSVKSKEEYSAFNDFARFNGKHLFVVDSNSWKEVAGEITIAETAFNIANFAFEGLNISQLKIKGVKSIGVAAFRNCLDLNSVTLSTGTELIDEYAFENCWNIDNVYFDGTIENWCEITFGNRESNPKWQGSMGSSEGTRYQKSTIFNIKDGDGWKELTDLIISSTITEIKPFTFMYFDITSLKINDSVVKIGKSAFECCDNLTSIILSNNLEYVDGSAFYGACVNNFTFNVYEKCKYIGSKDNPYLVLVESEPFAGETDYARTIHKDCKFMVDYAFMNNSSLIELKLENNSQLKEFTAGFSCCGNLEKITISKNITKISENIFEPCRKLNTIYYQGTAEEWNEIEITGQNTTSKVIANATKYFYSVTKPTTEGNYWHYDTDGITPIAW